MSRVGRSMLLFGAVAHLAGVVASAEFVERIMTPKTWRDMVWAHRLFIAHVAKPLVTPVAVLLQVPAQPILEGRRAHMFDRYMATRDGCWALFLSTTIKVRAPLEPATP